MNLMTTPGLVLPKQAWDSCWSHRRFVPAGDNWSLRILVVGAGVGAFPLLGDYCATAMTSPSSNGGWM